MKLLKRIKRLFHTKEKYIDALSNRAIYCRQRFIDRFREIRDENLGNNEFHIFLSPYKAKLDYFSEIIYRYYSWYCPGNPDYLEYDGSIEWFKEEINDLNYWFTHLNEQYVLYKKDEKQLTETVKERVNFDFTATPFVTIYSLWGLDKYAYVINSYVDNDDIVISGVIYDGEESRFIEDSYRLDLRHCQILPMLRKDYDYFINKRIGFFSEKCMTSELIQKEREFLNNEFKKQL